jgi:23S rRNA (uracil1939-C5)-methyltransferase
MEKELIISHLSLKGKGIGHLENGDKVEVFASVPGDRLSVSLGKRRRGTYRGSILEIKEPSPLRILPRCQHASFCGGCLWQMMSYEGQLQEKQARVTQIFSQFSPSIEPIIAAPSPWHYRNKMEFSFSQDKAGTRYLGLSLANTKGRIFNVERCHLAEEWIAQLLAALRIWWQESGLSAYHLHRNEGTLRTLIVREGKRTEEKLILLTVSGHPGYALKQQQIAQFVSVVQKALASESVSIFLRIQQQLKGSPTHFYEMHLAGPEHIHEKLHLFGREYLFKISPTSFFQPNTLQAEKLYAAAIKMSGSKKREVIFDLYCGTATLGILFASQAQRVFAIEQNPYALFDAEINRELNGVSNLQLVQGDVEEKLRELPDDPDLIIVDPPRAGLSQKALQLIILKNPKEILYISCNPSTQAENIKDLHRAGYQLERVQPIDQFPHTPHIENIAFLKKI